MCSSRWEQDSGCPPRQRRAQPIGPQEDPSQQPAKRQPNRIKRRMGSEIFRPYSKRSKIKKNRQRKMEVSLTSQQYFYFLNFKFKLNLKSSAIFYQCFLLLTKYGRFSQLTHFSSSWQLAGDSCQVEGGR